MTIDKNFLDLITSEIILNETQASLLEINFPIDENFDELLEGKEVSLQNTNLLILLKGDLNINAQKQIVNNYTLLKNFTAEKKNTKPKIEKKVIAHTGENKIDIYCDGACSNNPGKSGSGIAVYKNSQEPILLHGKYLERGTNNTAELQALFKALQIAANNKNNFNVTIYSDSKYSIDCISTWAYSWKSKNWTKKSGEIKNLEIIKEAHNLFDEIKDKITLKHVKAHAGIEGNELADRMAMYTLSAKNDEFEEYKYKSIQEVLDFTRG